MPRIKVTEEEWKVIEQGRLSLERMDAGERVYSGATALVSKVLGNKFYDNKYYPGLFYGFEVVPTPPTEEKKDESVEQIESVPDSTGFSN